MIDTLLAQIAPHHCCGCGQIGTLLCDNCKYNISFDEFNTCLNCNMPTSYAGICGKCQLPYSKAWCVGERTDVLEKLINSYKFERMRQTYAVLGDLLLEKIDQLPKETIVVPIPTVSAHIRERGYDHALLVAKYFARRRGLKCEQLLQRVTSTKQRGAPRSLRGKQAKEAFALKSPVTSDAFYLLVDDVVTTGATMKYAAQTIKDGGAQHIWAAAIARQPLD